MSNFAVEFFVGQTIKVNDAVDFKMVEKQSAYVRTKSPAFQ